MIDDGQQIPSDSSLGEEAAGEIKEEATIIDATGSTEPEVVKESDENKVVSIPVPEPEVIEEEPEEQEPVWPKMYHCSSCKSDLPGDTLKKIPLDYTQDPKDGSVKAGKVRFTLLCGKCDSFLRVYDPGFVKALDKAFPKKN